MPFLPSPEAPFGFLNPIHTYALTHSTPVTSTNWPKLFLVPLLPLFIQCYYMQFKGTRMIRAALGMIGIGVMIHAWGSYRFDRLDFQAFNDGLGIAFLHLIGKYVEFGLLQDPIIDPYTASGRSSLMSTLDLAINSRMVGLGAVGMGGAAGPDGGVKVGDGQVSSKSRERWLPYSKIKRTKASSLRRHAVHAFVHYASLDTLSAALRYWGSDNIANPNGFAGSMAAYNAQNHFVFLPHILDIPVPPILVTWALVLTMVIGIWQGMSWIYHLFAFIAVGSGLWEVSSYEVDLFDQPWKADSMLDLWGRRWHQIFRHHFLLLGTNILKFAGQNPTGPLLLILIYFFSGSMHALGQFQMSPMPSPIPLAGFFVLSGFGVVPELLFRRMTGRRVHGWLGRAWGWAYLLVVGRLLAMAALDAGLGGAGVTPDFYWSPGRILTRFIARYVVESKRYL